ncbi:DnaJ domain-containing protein [Purpureocillium lavendulum]|uniref:DnaJ domain-containing protein n=1 Tax=Purpureocillium lavendulum TaxID=1247861 RepID=A0AB34FSD9_9HYPO|nr:DnaJ domain-containing protein [Purpureocillium lavendulum]
MTPLPADPYKTLGVSKDAQIPEIRSAHRKLVLKCHPDKIQDPKLKAEKQDEFQKVQEAYELLSDDRQRQKYDDQVKLAELREQFRSKANISTPRSSPREYNVYTAEPRTTARPRSPASAPKPYSTYSRSWEDEVARGPRIFDAGTPRSSRREASFAERPSKREVEREREKDREIREREKERDRERRKREDAMRRAEKDAKEQRRAEKRLREKQRDKEIRRETDEKKRHARPYIETYDEDSPSKSDKKKPSSRRYEEKRDRSSGREDAPMPPLQQRSSSEAYVYAKSYIQASKAKSAPGIQRSATYHPRAVQPPAPTPPPVATQSPFAAPLTKRERSYRASSREALDDPIVVSASPASRHAAQFQKSASTTPVMSSSPPRVTRTTTMPVDAGFSRPAPGIVRAQTFNAFGEGAPRGRDRSRMHAQIEEESDSDDMYERRARERDQKHRARRHRSPDGPRPENVSRYQIDAGRAKPLSYSRRLDAEADPYRYYSTVGGIPVVETRPPMPPREGSYSASGSKFPKVKTSKAYGYDDVQYSNYYDKPHREEYSAYA